MKKQNGNNKNDMQSRQSMREIRLQTLIFGGEAPAKRSLGTSLLGPADHVTVKWPDDLGE